MSFCGRPDTAAILLPSPMVPRPLRNGGRQTPAAIADDGCSPGKPHRHGTARPSPGTCAGNQLQRPGVERFPSAKRTTSLRGTEGDTHFPLLSRHAPRACHQVEPPPCCLAHATESGEGPPCGGVRRTAEKGREGPDAPGVVFLHLLLEPARHHVVNHALTKRAADWLVEHREDFGLEWG